MNLLHASKRWIVASLLLSAALWAQPAPEQQMAGDLTGSQADVHGPTYSQVYCSGFITRDAVPRSSFILGSKESPHEDRFQQRSVLFLSGPNFTEGERYSVLRQVADPNHEDSSPDQSKKLAALGDHYEDIGWVTVHSIEKGLAIATLDFACDAAIPGDILVPFQERPRVTFHDTDFELGQFRAGSARVTGQILGGRDFDSLLGDGQTVYTDFGSSKGAHPGDFLVISRGYASQDLNKIDRASESLPIGAESSAVNPAKLPADRGSLMPNHILGELVILSVSPDSSTAIVTRSVDALQLGDRVQLEGAADEDSERQDAMSPRAGKQTAAAQDSCRASGAHSWFHHMLVGAHLSHGCKAAAPEAAPGGSPSATPGATSGAASGAIPGEVAQAQ